MCDASEHTAGMANELPIQTFYTSISTRFLFSSASPNVVHASEFRQHYIPNTTRTINTHTSSNYQPFKYPVPHHTTQYSCRCQPRHTPLTLFSLSKRGECQARVVFTGRKRAIKTLKPSFFVSGFVGTFVGFPKHKRVIDGFARCLLCRADISIADRGVHNLWDHWKGREHTRLEQKYRTMSNKPLLDKSCRPVSMAEDRRIRAERMSEPPVFLESTLNLSVDEMTAIELAEETAGAKPQLTESSGAYL